MQDLWADHRELLNRGIARHLDDETFTSGQLVREQIEASEPGDYQTAALACLSAAQSVGGAAEAALPGAVAIAYMSQMAVVFMGLENSGGAPSLSTAWGMPRSLNAGDAMFVLANESLLSAPEDLTASTHLKATVVLDRGSRDMLDALLARDGEGDLIAAGQKALLPSAMALGGLLGGGDDATRERLYQLGRQWAELADEDMWRMLASDPDGWLAT